jgi:HK97 family phage portal protein
MIRQILSAFGYERRSDSPYAPEVWGRAIRSGGFVSPGAVLSNLAVAVRCVSLRSELLASVPLKLYRRLPNGDRERVSDSALADVLGDLFSPLQSAFEGREFMVRSLDLHGNAYARIDRDGQGQVSALWPLEPSRVTVERLENGRLRYRHSGDRGSVVLLQEEVLHIRASSEDGLVGRSPIAIARAALALGINLNDTAGTLASSGMRISGVLSHPGKLSPAARENLRGSFEKEHSGPKNAGRTLLLEEGSKFIPTQFSSSDAELLESRRLSNEDTARIFGVPPASVGISNSVSYGSAQQAAADLVQNALAPLASRIEQAMQRCLLSTEARRTLIIEHDLSGLLRGDATSRWTAYRTAREIGALSSKEIRRIENLGPMDPADDYTPLRAAPQQAEPPIASVKP